MEAQKASQLALVALIMACSIHIVVGDSFSYTASSDTTTTYALYDASYPDLRVWEFSNWTLDYAVNGLTTGDVVTFRVTSDTRAGCEMVATTGIGYSYGSSVVKGTDPPTVSVSTTAGETDLTEVLEFNFGTVSSPTGGADGTITVVAPFVVPEHKSIFGSDVKEVPGSGGVTWTPCAMKGEVLVNGGAVYVQDREYEIVDVELRVVKNLVGNNSEVDAGDTVTFQIEIGHYNSPTGDQVRLSHLATVSDVRIIDTMSEELRLVPDTITISPANMGYIKTGNGSADTSIEIVVPTLGQSDVIRIEYKAVVNISVGAASQIVNVAQLRATRDGYGNTYKYLNDTETLATPAPETQFSILNSSLTETNYSTFIPTRMDVAVGEIVTLLIDHSLPEGSNQLNQFEIIISTNPGVMVVDAIRTRAPALQIQYPNGTARYRDTNGDGIADIIDLDFGIVVNTPDNKDDDNDHMYIEIDLLVPDRDENVNGVQVSAQIVSKFGTGEVVCHETRWNNGQSKKVLLPLNLGTKTATDFYDYRDSFAHTGEEEWDRALMYFVRFVEDNQNKTAFVLVYDKPTGTGAPAGHDGGAIYLTMDSDGLAGLDINLHLEDDPGTHVCPIDANTDAALNTMKNDNYCWDVATGTGEFRQKWINTKTDGMVLGYFPNTNWCLRPTWKPAPFMSGGSRYYENTLEGISELAVMTANADGSMKKTFIPIAESTGLEICGFTCDKETGLLSSKATSLNFDVLRPDLAYARTASHSSGDANDVVAHTVTVSHDGPCALHSSVQNKSCSAVYDVRVQVTLDADSLFSTGPSVTTGAAYSVVSSTTTHYEILVPVMKTDESVVISYSRTIQQSAVPNTQIPATYNITAFSGKDSRGKRFENVIVEPFVVTAPAIVSVQVTDTSQALSTKSLHDPALDDVVVGETVTFHASLDIPEATSNMNLTFELVQGPGSLELLSSRVVSIGSNLNFGSGLAVGNSGVHQRLSGSAVDNVATFVLGTVVNTADNTVDAKDRTVLEVVARVVDYFNNTNGQRLDAVATLAYSGQSISATQTVEVIGSTLVIAQASAVTETDYPETYTYTLTVSHSGSSSPAYAVNITDTLPSHLVPKAGTASTNRGSATISGQTVTIEAGQFSQADPNIVVTFDVDTASSVSALVDGTIIPNNAHVAWYVLDGVDTTRATAVSPEVNVTVKHVCGNGGVSAWEKCDDGNTADNDGCSSNCTIIETGFLCDNSTTPNNCTLIGPQITSAVANDPDDGDYYYSVGDTVGISFDMATNQPAVNTKAAIDSIITASPVQFGGDYSGTWASASQLVITIVTAHTLPTPALNSTNPFPAGGYPIPGEATVSLTGSGVKNAAATSLDGVPSAVTLSGDWGRLGPVIASFVADDPDDGDALHSTGDTLTITFDRPVKALSLANTAAVTSVFNFSSEVGDGLSGAWLSNTAARITITDASISGSAPVIGALTVSTLLSGGLTDPTGFTLGSASTSPAVSGDWGTLPGPTIASIVANDPGDGDTVFSTGDTIVITFSEATNKPAVATIANVDALVSFSPAVPANFTGAWNGAGTILTLTVVDVTPSATAPSTSGAGAPTATLLVGGGLRNAGSTSLVSTDTSGQLTGNWGLPRAPAILSAVANDPDDSDVIYSVGDTITVTFDGETNRPGKSSFTFCCGIDVDIAWQDNTTVVFTVNTATSPAPVIGSASVSVSGSAVTIPGGVAGVTTSEQFGSSATFTGDWGEKTAPTLASAVASDPDNADSVFSAGDTITLTFDVDTNTPSLTSAGSVFTFSPSIGNNFTAAWVPDSKRVAVLTIVGTQGVTSPPAIGSATVSVVPGRVKTADGQSFFTSQHTTSRATITGNWGAATGPVITSVVGGDPDNGDSIFSVGDTVTIAFSYPTNGPTVTSKADLDSVIAFTPSLGTNYSAVWDSKKQVITVTILELPASRTNLPGPFWAIDGSAVAPAFEAKLVGGKIWSVDLKLGPTSQTWTGISGNWGLLSAPALQSVYTGDPDDADAIFGPGDEIVIEFATKTNEIAVGSKTDIDKVFSFYKLASTPSARLLQAGEVPSTASRFDPGAKYSGAWSPNSIGGSTLRIELVDTTGAVNVPNPGSLLVRVHGYVRDDQNKSLPAQNLIKSDVDNLTPGDWGLLEGPSVVEVACSDPDNLDNSFSAGDRIQVTFNSEPKHVAVATKADLDMLLSWTSTNAVDSPVQSIGNDYRGSWLASNPRILEIEILDTTGVSPAPIPGSLTAHLRPAGNLTNLQETSLPGRGSVVANGDWGRSLNFVDNSGGARTLTDGQCRTFWCLWWWLIVLGAIASFIGCIFMWSACMQRKKLVEQWDEARKAKQAAKKPMPDWLSNSLSPVPRVMSPILQKSLSRGLIASPPPMAKSPPPPESQLVGRQGRNLPMLKVKKKLEGVSAMNSQRKGIIAAKAPPIPTLGALPKPIAGLKNAAPRQKTNLPTLKSLRPKPRVLQKSGSSGVLPVPAQSPQQVEAPPMAAQHGQAPQEARKTKVIPQLRTKRSLPRTDSSLVAAPRNAVTEARSKGPTTPTIPAAKLHHSTISEVPEGVATAPLIPTKVAPAQPQAPEMKDTPKGPPQLPAAAAARMATFVPQLKTKRSLPGGGKLATPKAAAAKATPPKAPVGVAKASAASPGTPPPIPRVNSMKASPLVPPKMPSTAAAAPAAPTTPAKPVVSPQLPKQSPRGPPMMPSTRSSALSASATPVKPVVSPALPKQSSPPKLPNAAPARTPSSNPPRPRLPPSLPTPLRKMPSGEIIRPVDKQQDKN